MPAPPPPRRRFSQNFLVDTGAVARIVAALAPRPGEAVLEIGPGRGALTASLVAAAGRVAAVEIDARLAAWLRARFDASVLLLFERDALDLELASVAPALGLAPGSPLVIAGNLPYHVSKPIASRLVDERAHVARAVLMFQREVASRLVAPPASADYGPLAIRCGLTYAIERCFDLAPGAFRPAPKVVSTVTRWTPRAHSPLDDPELDAAMRGCLRAAFARRRQTLRNNLRAALGSLERAERLLDRARLDGGSRAEQIDPEGFLRLAAHWRGAALV